MPSKLNAYLLSAVMLAALLQLAPGAPVVDAPTDTLAGDTSGEEEPKLSDLLRDLMLDKTKRHKGEFEDEFKDVQYLILDNYKTSSLPKNCSNSSISEEVFLHSLAHDLLIYTVILKFVEKEFPNSRIPKEARVNGGNLISLIKGKMRNPEQVTALTSSQEEVLLKDLDNPDIFHRKMTAHSILRQLHYFLVDCKIEINKRSPSSDTF